MLKVKYLVFFSLISGLLLWSCSGNKPEDESIHTEKASQYGGVLKFNCEFHLQSLYPLSIGEAVSYRIGSQIFEGLVKLHPDSLTVEPCLAERWTADSSASVFTFYLRKGVQFHNDPCFAQSKGREVTAYDVKYCLDKMCEYSPYNQMFWLVKDKIKGAKEYFQQTQSGNFPENGVEGVKVIDKYTLQIELTQPFAIFPKVMTHSAFWIYPKEAVETYGKDIAMHPVGTGAFVLKKINSNEAVFLAKNPDYWRKDKHGNPLPYLDGIKFLFLLDNDVAFLEFKKKKIDVLYFNSLFKEQVKSDVKQKMYKLISTSSLATTFLGFNNQKYPFNDKNVRLALAYGVDFSKLRNQSAVKTINGFVAPMKNYPYFDTEPIPFDPLKARKLLEQAGFNKENPFPKITCTVTFDYEDDIEIFQRELYDNLGIEAEFEILSMDLALGKYISGDALLWFSSWYADYPDPENFLNLLYGKNVPDNPKDNSYVNWFRYKNERFDSLFEAALQTIDEEERNRLFQQAEQLAISDAALVPVNYSNYIILQQHKVQNIHYNSIHFYDLSEVYLSK